MSKDIRTPYPKLLNQNHLFPETITQEILSEEEMMITLNLLSRIERSNIRNGITIDKRTLHGLPEFLKEIQCQDNKLQKKLFRLINLQEFRDFYKLYPKTFKIDEIMLTCQHCQRLTNLKSHLLSLTLKTLSLDLIQE